MEWFHKAVQAIDALVHLMDGAQYAALAIVLLGVIAALQIAGVIVTQRLVRGVGEFRDANDELAERQRELLEAMLRQINGCAIDVAHLKQQMSTYATTRDSQLEERKKILKTIAGHLANAPQRGL